MVGKVVQCVEMMAESLFQLSVLLPYRSLPPEIRLRRNYTTRAEVQRVLGTIKMKKKGERCELNYLNSEKFDDSIGDLQDPKNKGVKQNTLVIPCSPEEIDQFDPATANTIEEWRLFPDVIDKARKKA